MVVCIPIDSLFKTRMRREVTTSTHRHEHVSTIMSHDWIRDVSWRLCMGLSGCSRACYKLQREKHDNVMSVLKG